ncbi:hypothetical protein Gotur_013652 [Gossypium turneri]
MLPLHQSNDLVYQIFSHTKQHKIPQDSITDQAVVLETKPLISNPTMKNHRRKICHMEGDTNSDKFNKIKLYNEIEQQRRQYMASLYASLRSLLPGKYIKGKRSMLDYMNKAVNYIKHLEKKVKDLDEN